MTSCPGARARAKLQRCQGTGQPSPATPRAGRKKAPVLVSLFRFVVGTQQHLTMAMDKPKRSAVADRNYLSLRIEQRRLFDRDAIQLQSESPAMRWPTRAATGRAADGTDEARRGGLHNGGRGNQRRLPVKTAHTHLPGNASGGSGLSAGPCSTCPSTTKREKWQGQSQDFSARLQCTTQPRCVHTAEHTCSAACSSRYTVHGFTP